MAKVIKINGEMVSIGMDDGSIREVYIGAFNFTPSIGDEVEIFTNEREFIVSKVNTNPSYANSNYNQNYVVNNVNNPRRKINKTVYCLLAFLLGGLGAHKFYVGKVGSGILYIIFCWTGIPLIISIIELIIGLIKPADELGNYID